MFLAKYAASGAKTLVLDLKSSEGKIALYSDLSAGPITVKVDDGTGAYVAYTSGGTATELDASNNQALIQGPGRFEIAKPNGKPMSVCVGTDSAVTVVSET